MPRRNKQVKHIPYSPVIGEGSKVRYGSKQAAEKAADLRMLQVPGLELEVYQALDGGWYLTSRKTD
jgi:hypothetical protein